ncbi:MAG: ABC transporter ATP-binding protein [Anaerovoracaceae bacterium]
MKNILTINNLTVAFKNPEGPLIPVKGVSLQLAAGETLALVGESGCGKTVLCKSMLKILCDKGSINDGEIILDGKDIVPIGEKEMEIYRGGDIAMIFQDPMTSLDPTMTVGNQIGETIRLHQGVNRQEAKKQAIELMRLVEIFPSEERANQMPHEFSGGMRQRVAIAIALAGKPKLLLADEPTTALDGKTEAQMISLLKSIQQKTQVSMIFITHDLSLVEEIAHNVAIMEKGVIVEQGKVSAVFGQPNHPYTQKLLGFLDYKKGKGHNHKERVSLEKEVSLVKVENLTKDYLLGKNKINHALSNVSMEIRKGEILGLVGPSGCGKSTLSRCIMDMEKPTNGKITFNNQKKSRNWKQMIFQDSDSAFNSRMTIEAIIGEPLKIATGKKTSREKIGALMRDVELDQDLMTRHPYSLSGGQRQRVAIARALSVEPELIIADEPISSLDVSTQAQIVHLFRRLRDEKDLTILFIAHDLPMVNHISDRIIKLI